MSEPTITDLANHTDNNIIDQKAIGDLLCGYKFYIPSYQRGYRWTKQQVIDLCNDLLEYALKPKPVDRPKAFYSIQPLVVKPRVGEENAYDVIDGQQRLTTIYILMRFLLAELFQTPESYAENTEDFKLYSIHYDTRSDDTNFISTLGIGDWRQRFFSGETSLDIDIAHIYNAFIYMREWLRPPKDYHGDTALKICERCGEKFSPNKIANKLFELLKNGRGTNAIEGNAQFIWYQLAPDKDAINEFIKENKGKIGLTDTERIRALFLQRNDKNDEVDSVQQLGIAKDWDEIENTLQNPDFWAFISNQEIDDGRIGLIFRYIHAIDKKEDVNLPDDLYRFYDEKFNIRKTKANNVARTEWSRVMEAFRMLKNWHNDAYLYNIIGLLTKEGVSMNHISELYHEADVHTLEDFKCKINQEINHKCLPKTKEEAHDNETIGISSGSNKELGFAEGEMHLDLNYNDDKDKIRSLMRFLNIRILCKQIEEHRTKNPFYSGNEYRFAFDLYDNESWDVEHIDSATTNELKGEKVQKKWVETAEAAMKMFDPKVYDEFLAKKKAWEDDPKNLFAELHQFVVAKTDGEADGEERKNWVGNLTLLNREINRGYGNSIFAAKGQEIDKKVNQGAFVPVCTRMVFYKAIPGNSISRLEWKFDDKKAYHAWMLKEVMDFKRLYPFNETKNK